MMSEAPTYHVDTTVTAAFINTQVALGESYDVSGNDYAGVATTNNEDGVFKIRVVRLGTRLFIKQGGNEWVEQADITPDNVWGATSNDAYSTLQYVGAEVRDGKTVQHIVLNVAGWPVRSTEYMLISQQPQVSKWDVWIDEAGHPVFAQMQGSFHGIVNRASIPIAMLFQYTFSAAGEPVEIELPAGFD
jgi:hypothetical protein